MGQYHLQYIGFQRISAEALNDWKRGPYPTTILCPENVVCFLCLLHILKCTSD